MANTKETRSDDLRTGMPLWVRTPHSTVKAGSGLADRRAEVVVVGAGISGALVAEALTRRGRAVLILDARPPARGSTAASTAMIQHEIDVPLIRLRSQIGRDRADRAWLRSVQAVADLVALQERLKLDCQMHQKQALYLAGTEMGARALAQEAEARAAIGIRADYLKPAALRKRFGMDRSAAILSVDSASANPAQLTAGLLRTCLERGARIVSPVEVTDFAELSGGVALATRSGRVIVAEHAVFCTGYEYLHQMQTRSHHVTSTWALASRPLQDLPEWLQDTIVWEASDPYLYFRTDAAGRMIAGGEDEAASDRNADPALLSRKARAIAQKLEKLTGVRIGKPAYTWSAPFSVTDDGLPIIDRVPGHDRSFAVMGFGGNGITFSMIGAQILATALAGKKDPDAEIFRYR